MHDQNNPHAVPEFSAGFDLDRYNEVSPEEVSIAGVQILTEDIVNVVRIDALRRPDEVLARIEILDELRKAA